VVPSPLYLLLAKIIIGTTLACSVAWLIDYSRTGAWRNPVGQTLLTKTVIISALLLVSWLTTLFRFDFRVLNIIRWGDLGLVALVAPVMVWRMVVFHRVTAARLTCSNGHSVSGGANFCPMCGVPMSS